MQKDNLYIDNNNNINKMMKMYIPCPNSPPLYCLNNDIVKRTASSFRFVFANFLDNAFSFMNN